METLEILLPGISKLTLNEILIFVAIYIVSAMILIWYFKVAHSKIGRWSNLKNDKPLLIFIPLYNTLAIIIFYMMSGGPKRKN